MQSPYVVPDFVQELLAVSSSGVTAIIQKLSSLLSLPVLVVDPFYQVLFFSTGNEAVDEIVIIPDNEQEFSSVFNCQISTVDTIKNGVAHPITVNSKKLGFLILSWNDAGLDARRYEEVLSYASSLCALQMQKSLEIKREKQKFKEAFLFDLLYGNIKQKEDIIEYGEIWGWDFHVPHTVIVFSSKEEDHFFTNKQMINTLLQIVEKELIMQNVKPIAMVKHQQVITMFPQADTNHDVDRGKLQAFTETILKNAAKLAGELEIACGIGKRYTNPAELFRSYQEAKIALELGILLEISTPMFADLGLERILYKHDLQDLIEFHNHTLGSLLEYDKKHDGYLFVTLEALVANQFDIGKTAAASFLHRNTLRYRVKKIEDILDVKLDDLHVRLNILAAFKIRQLRKIGNEGC